MSSIIFDLDGTLLDTLEDLSDSMNAALKQCGWPQHPTTSYRYFIGEGLDALVQKTLPKCEQQSVISKTKLRTAMQEEYTSRWKNKSRLYEGIVTLLNELTARHIPMAILSNKPEAFTQNCVTKFLSQWEFTVVYGARKGIPYKPDPTSALDIAQKLKQEGLIKREWQFKLYLKTHGLQNKLHAGSFELKTASSIKEIVTTLTEKNFSLLT